MCGNGELSESEVWTRVTNNPEGAPVLVDGHGQVALADAGCLHERDVRRRDIERDHHEGHLLGIDILAGAAAIKGQPGLTLIGLALVRTTGNRGSVGVDRSLRLEYDRLVRELD